MKNLAARDLNIVETAITATAHAFADSRFLVVFDAFESYLGPSNELADDVLQSILNAVIRVPGETKLLAISSRRPSLRGDLRRVADWHLRRA